MGLEHHAGADVYVARRGQGAPMMMLHCSLASHEALLRLAGMVEDLYAVTLMDHPGHGRSAPWAGTPPVVELSKAQALELIDGPTHVVGHSLGGLVALHMAVAAPEKIAALTLIEPVLMSAAKGPGAAQHSRDWGPFQEAFNAGDLEAAARRFVGLWGVGLPWDRLPAKQRQKFMSQIHLVGSTTSDVTRDPSGIEAVLSQITCPVTLIEGAQSHPIIAEIHDTLEAAFPNVRRIRVEGAGHMVPLTHPAAVAEAIRG